MNVFILTCFVFRSTEYTVPTREEPERLQKAEEELNVGFKLSMEKREYGEQYSHIYFDRLTLKRPQVYAVAKDAWEGIKIDGEVAKHSLKVLDLGTHPLSWAVGTVYREMKFKPSILEQITANHFGAPPPPPKKYTDPESDEVTLEDESGRIRLVGNLAKDASACLVTGCIIAVLGRELPSGDFDVLDMRFAECAPQKPIPKPKSDKPKYLALTSGLGIKGSAYEGYTLQLLKEFLTGELAGPEEQTESAEIVQVVIAGNSLDADDEEEAEVSTEASSNALLPDAVQLAQVVKKKTKEVNYGYDRSQFHPEPMQHLDSFVADIASSVPVTIMPGDTDLANVTLPQQRIHPALFQSARKLNIEDKTCFDSVTNPSWFELGDEKEPIMVFGSSGQPINDMYKYLPEETVDRLDLLSQTLRWQHAAPTAPDTLSAYSFYEQDPFIFNETPHIYFAGNQPTFDTRMIQAADNKGENVSVRLVSVPSFSKTGELVLVNLNSETFETTSIRFG